MGRIKLPDFDLLYRQVGDFVAEHQDSETGYLSTVTPETMYAMVHDNAEDSYGNPTYTEYPILAVRVADGYVEIALNRPDADRDYTWESLRYSDDILFEQTLLEIAYMIEIYVE